MAKVKDLIPDDKNFNKGNEYGESLIAKSFQKFGAGRSILLDKNNKVIAGNKSLQKFAEQGLEDVQIIETDGKRLIAVKRTDIDLDTPQGREMALADNATAKANIEWDIPQLEMAIQEFDLPVSDWGVKMPHEVSEDDYEIPDEIQTDIVLGDLFEIGEHRLLCGDSTNPQHIDKLMINKKADMIFTDPPYGVNYSGGIQFTNEGIKKDQRTKLANDDSEQIYADSVPLMASITDGPIYTWFAGSKAGTLYNTIAEVGEIHALIIWVKNGGYGALNANYKQKHEPCLYWKPKGGKLNFCGSTTETTIWEIDKDGKNKMHPTQKPVALAAKAIGNHSVGLIADLFLGSGTTMVASHQLNRKCYGMELDPKYCQIIVDRMKKLDPSIEIKLNGKPYIKKDVNSEVTANA